MAKKKIKFDVTTHILVPKHTKLNKTDTKKLFERLNISIKELPKISIKDPTVAPLNVEPGDVVKITRPSPTAGVATYYRGVVNE